MNLNNKSVKIAGKIYIKIFLLSLCIIELTSDLTIVQACFAAESTWIA